MYSVTVGLLIDKYCVYYAAGYTLDPMWCESRGNNARASQRPRSKKAQTRVHALEFAPLDFKFCKLSVARTHREKDEILLIVLPDAVVHPGTMVVHFADAALADGAVVRALRLDAAALGALEDDLALAEAHLFYGLLGSVAFGHGALRTK